MGARSLEAEYELKAIVKEAAEKSAILRSLRDLERKVEEIPRKKTGKPSRKP